MTDTELLNQVKADLQILTDRHDQYINNLIETAKSDLINETGLELYPESSTADRVLVAMYAAWLYRKRANDGDRAKMPRMLEYKIRKRMFFESTTGGGNT